MSIVKEPKSVTHATIEKRVIRGRAQSSPNSTATGRYVDPEEEAILARMESKARGPGRKPTAGQSGNASVTLHLLYRLLTYASELLGEPMAELNKAELKEDIAYVKRRLQPKDPEQLQLVRKQGRPASQYSVEWEGRAPVVVDGPAAAAELLGIAKNTMLVHMTRHKGKYTRHVKKDGRETWVLCKRLGTKNAALQEPCQNPKNATGRENGPNGNRSGAER